MSYRVDVFHFVLSGLLSTAALESRQTIKELTIHHYPAEGDSPARVRVGYCPREGAQVQERHTEFRFYWPDEERSLMQWYLEEYLLFPWANFKAEQAEALMERKGQELFQAVFGGPETSRLFANVVNDLPNTRIVIHTSDPSGIALPWELMRDPQRGSFGGLAHLAQAFVRSQPDLFFEPPELKSETTFNILLVISRPKREDG